MTDNPVLAPIPQSRQINRLALFGLLILTIGLRLPGLDRPLTGNFATKNVVYAMIARNWAEGRAGLLEPTLDCLVGGQRSLHLLEFPVSAYASGLLWKLFGGSLDVWGRVTAIAFTAGAVALLYLMVVRWHGPIAAAGAGLVLALSPVSILYGRSFMLEASVAFFAVASIWAWDGWLRGGRWPWLAASAASVALLMLLKIYMLVLLLPLAAMFWREKKGTVPICAKHPPGRSGKWGLSPFFLRRLVSALAIAAAIMPAAAWYRYAAAAAAPGSPVADRVYYSVRSSVEVHRPPHPLLWSADFYRGAFDDLAGPVLTPIGLALVLAGLLSPAWRRQAAWLAASVVLVLLLPRKFHEMNYYWIAVLPPLAILAGLGWQVLRERLEPSRLAQAGLLILALLISARYAVGPMLRIASEDRAVLPAAVALQELSGPDDRVVTLHGSTLDLLYYCRRAGWALDPESPNLRRQLEECRRQGARLAVIAGRDRLDAAVLPPQSELVRSGPGYAVYRLGAGH